MGQAQCLAPGYNAEKVKGRGPFLLELGVKRGWRALEDLPLKALSPEEQGQKFRNCI